MAVDRTGVFIEKVLKRLYCAPSSPSHLHGPSVLLDTSASTPKAEQEDSVNLRTSTGCTTFTDGETEIPNRRLYTVSLPPDGCLPCCSMTSSLTHSEHVESSKDSDEDSVCSTKKRARKKRQPKILQDLVGQTASKRQTHILQDGSDAPKMNKNKKRKMKKKRQKEKMKAAGLLTKASGVDFMYQPEKNENKEADVDDMDRKTSEILDFLMATQEICFTDRRSKCENVDICPETLREIMKHFENHKNPFSDVAVLHELKSLILLQDIERLKVALQHFKEHSTMLPEHVSVVYSLFYYWITDILPLRRRKHENGEPSVFT